MYLSVPLFVFAMALQGQGDPTPQVVMETTLGNLVIDLYPDKAPQTVENFLAYVRSGHYDGTVFHRVVPGFVIQGGGFTPDMVQKPTRPPIENEADNGLQNLRGTLSMARTASPNSATCQFFVNLVDNGGLDHRDKGEGWGYAVFAEVVDGMEVVDAIAKLPRGVVKGFQDVPKEPVVITKAYVKE